MLHWLRRVSRQESMIRGHLFKLFMCPAKRARRKNQQFIKEENEEEEEEEMQECLTRYYYLGSGGMGLD